MKLRDFTTLTFDVYGTLIDWETGLLAQLQPWLKARGIAVRDQNLLAEFARLESQWEAEQPRLLYPEILERVHGDLATHFGTSSDQQAAREFGASVGTWPAFADSREALQYLARHYRLVVLSNVDRASLGRSAALLGMEFDLRFTAQDIGSYKPSLTNFEYMLAHVGEEKGKILHVAQSLFHDHVPASAMGISSAWIDRRHDKEGGGATLPPKDMPRPARTFRSLAEFCEAHAAEA